MDIDEAWDEVEGFTLWAMHYHGEEGNERLSEALRTVDGFIKKNAMGGDEEEG